MTVLYNVTVAVILAGSVRGLYRMERTNRTERQER